MCMHSLLRDKTHQFDFLQLLLQIFGSVAWLCLNLILDFDFLRLVVVDETVVVVVETDSYFVGCDPLVMGVWHVEIVWTVIYSHNVIAWENVDVMRLSVYVWRFHQVWGFHQVSQRNHHW